MNTIFLAFPFRREFDELVQYIHRTVRSHGLVLITGEILGGGDLTPEIEKRIIDSDALVALLTREEKIEGKDEWRPSEWVLGEYNSARTRHQRAIAVVEAGVKVRGPYAGHQHIDLDRTALCETLVRLSETIGIWKLEAGRSLEIRLLPEAAATIASKDTTRCEYRLISPLGDETPWQVGRARPKPGGVFLVVPGVRQDATIEVRILEGDEPTWRSVQSPQWVHVELKSAL